MDNIQEKDNKDFQIEGQTPESNISNVKSSKDATIKKEPRYIDDATLFAWICGFND